MLCVEGLNKWNHQHGILALFSGTRGRLLQVTQLLFNVVIEKWSNVRYATYPGGSGVKELACKQID
jgi:hypothetical protein